MPRRLPRKVLHVLNGAGGGAALSVRALAVGLAKLGVRSCGVCHSMGEAAELESLRDVFDGELEQVDLYWWNRKLRTSAWKRPLLEARQWLRTGVTLGSTAKVAGVARRFGADLIHTNTLLTPEGARAARLLRLPHVWHVRELIGTGQPFQLSMSTSRLGRVLASYASLVIANSEASAAALRPVVPAERLRVVPNGIELEKFSRVARAARPVPVVGMVANLSSRTKRHALFIAAMRQLGGQAKGCIYGGGADRPGDAYVRQISADAQAAGVELRGFAEPERIMAELDVLVQPAENESFGRTVIEAMAAGVAVVGADGGGVGELIDDDVDGLKFTPGAADELAQAVETLCKDAKLRARLAEAARAKATRRFSIEAMTHGVGQAYEAAMPYPLHTTWEGVAEAFGLA